MVWLKFLIITLLFFVLALAQNSFFPHISVLGFTPNLIFALCFVLIFFENPTKTSTGFFSIIIAGFLLDVFSPFYFGASMISLLLIYLLFKLTGYFLNQLKGKLLLLYFIPMFLVFFALYNVLCYLLTNFPHLSISIPSEAFAGLAYNLAFVMVMFFIHTLFIKEKTNNKQLKLFQ